MNTHSAIAPALDCMHTKHIWSGTWYSNQTTRLLQAHHLSLPKLNHQSYCSPSGRGRQLCHCELKCWHTQSGLSDMTVPYHKYAGVRGCSLHSTPHTPHHRTPHHSTAHHTHHTNPFSRRTMLSGPIEVVLHQHVSVGGLVVRFDTLSLWHSPTFTEVLQQDRQHQSPWKGDTDVDTSSAWAHTTPCEWCSNRNNKHKEVGKPRVRQMHVSVLHDQTTPHGELVAHTKPLLLVT